MKPRAKAFDEFAPVQFMELSDAERLDAPPFEPMPSGTSLDGRCELTLLLSPAVAGRLAEESRRQNIQTEFLVVKVLERLVGDRVRASRTQIDSTTARRRDGVPD